MTNAEKFKEVFGFDIDYSYGLCNLETCDTCPFKTKKDDECMDDAHYFWDNDYEEVNADDN